MKNYFRLFRKKKQAAIMITIPEPCGEVWSEMKPVGDCHRHCEVCDRMLTDFSVMSDDELMIFFHQSKGKVCGRFRKDQLNRSLTPLPPRTNKAIWWKAALLLPFTLFAKKGSAQQVAPDSVQLEMQDSAVAKITPADSLSLTNTLYPYSWIPMESNDGGINLNCLYSGGTVGVLTIEPPVCTTGWAVTVMDTIAIPEKIIPTESEVGAAGSPAITKSKVHSGRHAAQGFGNMASPQNQN